MKYFYYITPHISRLILYLISQNESYSAWMKTYLSPKEFYKIKNLGLSKLKINELSDFIIKACERCFIKIDSLDILYILQSSNKLGLILMFLRSEIIDNHYVKDQTIFKYLFISKIKKLKSITTERIYIPYVKTNKVIKKFTIIAPICPDYSYIVKKDGSYKYTFESINDGIGVVAKKAIRNCILIRDAMENVNLDSLDIICLIGDFECNNSNLKRLNETKDSFYRKIKLSTGKINNIKGFKCNLMSDLCCGLETWNTLKVLMKHNLELNNYSDLQRQFPLINHDRNLISRLPLYKKWYGNQADFKSIFLEQVLEYILMGKLINEEYGNEAFLLASDHKAMRPYYGLNSTLSIIGSHAVY